MNHHILLAGVLSIAATSLGCNNGAIKPDDTGTIATTDGGATDGGGTADSGGPTDGGGTATWTSDCPALTVSETVISFGAIGLDSTATSTVLLTNACTGAGDLDVAASVTGDTAFVGALPTTTLSPGDAATVEISFTPADYGELSGTLSVTSTDADLPSVDIPLLGQAVADADGDGYDAIAAGGDDCNDNDAAVYPKDAEDAQDLVDDDCDGTVDEDWIDAGSVYLTEVMMNPVAVGDAYGEWFELRNASGSTIDLIGWRFTSDDGDDLVITDSVLLDDSDVIVFGLTADTTLNGGVDVDVVYSRDDLSLADSADSIFLYMGSTPMSEITYTSDWPLSPGASLSLDPTSGIDDNRTTPDLWCASTSDYGVGDLGTPGAENDWCSSIDHDGDGYSQDNGDCDDSDASLSPVGRDRQQLRWGNRCRWTRRRDLPDQGKRRGLPGRGRRAERRRPHQRWHARLDRRWRIPGVLLAGGHCGHRRQRLGCLGRHLGHGSLRHGHGHGLLQLPGVDR
ncbi:MAG: hypothetical protein GXP62_09670 [Oligoflexia bacterium]|nr:hypothetical protein [Oligoflexia bacterium]